MPPQNFYTARVTEVEVIDAPSLANYAQQIIGVPYPAGKEMAVLRKALKIAFVKHPGLTYQSMCRVVQWVRTRHKRPVHCHLIVGFIRYAWADGCLPELDPKDPRDANTEYEITWALEREEDPEWRRRLTATQGIKARADALRSWKQSRSDDRASALSA